MHHTMTPTPTRKQTNLSLSPHHRKVLEAIAREWGTGYTQVVEHSLELLYRVILADNERGAVLPTTPRVP